MPRRTEDDKIGKESAPEFGPKKTVRVTGDGSDDGRQFENYLGPPPLLYDEDETQYDNIFIEVKKELQPRNILEQVWTKEYVDLLWELLRLRRFKTKLLYTATEDSVSRVIRQFLPPLESHENVRLVARGWANRASSKAAEVDRLLEKAGLDREAIFAQILADKLDVIERIDLMIFRAEQRRNAALREIEQWREGEVEKLRKLRAAFEEGKITHSLPRGRK